MSDFSKAIATLEYNKILDLLASCCHTEGSKAEAMRLRPTSDVKRVKMLMAQTSDAKALASIKGSPSFGSVKDINPSLERADKGAQLNPRELLDIADVLRVSRTLIDYINVHLLEDISLADISEEVKITKISCGGILGVDTRDGRKNDSVVACVIAYRTYLVKGGGKSDKPAS